MLYKIELYFSRYAILLILILAFVIRLTGLGFGLPYLYGEDEAYIMGPVQNMLSTGDMNPHWFGFPGSFIMYILAAIFGVVFVMMFLLHLGLGYVSDFAGFLSLFRGDVTLNTTVFYVIGRLLMVIFAVTTVYLTYLIGKKLFSKHTGILASFCLSIAPLHIAHSRIIRPDITATMLILFSLYFLISYFKDEKNKKLLVLTSLFAGFAIAAKYTSGVIIMPILMFCLGIDKKRISICSFRYIVEFCTLKARVSKALFYIFVGFFLFAPYVVLDISNSAAGIIFETRSENIGHERLSMFQHHFWYLKGALSEGIGGVFFLIFASLGLGFALSKMRSYKTILFIIFPLLYYTAVVGFGNLRWSRWVIPVLPFEAILFGIGVIYGYEYLRRIPGQKFKRVVLLIFSVFFIYSSCITISRDIANGVKLTRKDTRTIAKEWVEARLPSGSRVAIESDTVQFRIQAKKNFSVMNMGSAIVNWPLAFYKSNAVDYILITRNLKETVFLEPGKYAVPIARYEELKDNAELLKVFDNKENPGPVIEIYRLAD